MSTETYNRILAAGQQLFIKQGYTATSMRQIAESANIGKATIYHHFPDKESIMMALLQESLSIKGEILLQVKKETDSYQRIQTATRASIGFLYGYANLIQIVRREIPGIKDQIQKGFTAFFKEYLELLAEAIRQGIEQGIFRPVDPEDYARVLLSMIQGTFTMYYLINERAETPEIAADALLDVYFKGLNTR